MPSAANSRSRWSLGRTVTANSPIDSRSSPSTSSVPTHMAVSTVVSGPDSRGNWARSCSLACANCSASASGISLAIASRHPSEAVGSGNRTNSSGTSCVKVYGTSRGRASATGPVVGPVMRRSRTATG
ncbi:hypothetical protein [Streptomyces sp. NPDC048845]|uniref:hypothetical protein n=1 Tax=Streptomyces sp. NPDC048845 TaxID=3155390 RepID=UPI00343910D9